MANYMVFDDVVRDEHYDLWIGDEAWELDYHLHKNPSRKAAPFAWLTDFVGWLPMPDGGEREAILTADYNAEMVEHVRDQPQIRDRVDLRRQPGRLRDRDGLGPGLPTIRDWTQQHFDFAGYITGFDAGRARRPRAAARRARLRRRTRRSAWSRSADPASAVRCSAR